jgi:hypothetical protein
MTGWSLRVVHLASTVAFAATLVLGGCADGLEVNGKLFDWMGISSSAMQQSKSEPQVAARAPLVLPPSTNRLPAPGSGQEQDDPTSIAALDDPDRKKAAAAKERERLHQAYCRGEIQWKEKIQKPDDAAVNRSPYGPCTGLLGDLTGNINKQ